jgi:geranylgeranyl diphosphate synthase type II
MSSMPTIQSTKTLINDELKSLFTIRIKEAADISPQYVTLWETIEKVSLAGGKRLRPYLTLLAYHAWGGQPSEAITKAALAQELVHLSLLIHDDIIDRDLNRHGQSNMTGHFIGIYLEYLPQAQERRHFAESAAMLAGDLLIAEAHYQLAESNKETLHSAFFSVVGGQLLDTEASFQRGPIDPLTIARHKTASYSFVAPLVSGAALANASKAQIATLTSFAENLGIGFQLRDDLIGTFGTQQTTGKSVDGDIREGKHTFLIEAFYKRASTETKDTFNQFFGKSDATDDEVNQARQLLETSGARQTVEAQIDTLAKAAHKNLEKLSLTSEYTKAFEDLIQFCLYRDR